MERNVKVNLIFGAVALVAVIIAIFAVRQAVQKQPDPNATYIENIKVLNQTIKNLREEIESYKVQVAEIDFQRRAIIAQLEKVKKDYEKSNVDLLNGDVDDDVSFLTNYLSKKDGGGE